jgi:hypothetical protein
MFIMIESPEVTHSASASLPFLSVPRYRFVMVKITLLRGVSLDADQPNISRHRIDKKVEEA